MHQVDQHSENVIKIFHNVKGSLLPKINKWIYDYEEMHKHYTNPSDSQSDSPSSIVKKQPNN